MKKLEQVTFEEVFADNERRIHYHIHKLRIRDPHQEFYQEALFAMWNAYERYEPDKGPLATYFNYMIRHRLIDLVRKKTRDQHYDKLFFIDERLKIDDGNRFCNNGEPIPNPSGITVPDTYIWAEIKLLLTEKQWKWIKYYIIADMSIKDISKQESVSIDAVKSWGRQVRRKLRSEGVKTIVKEPINN